MELPDSMGRGSKGPHVALLKAFLVGVCRAQRISVTKVYDQETADEISHLQKVHGLKATGVLDADTMALLKKVYGFDFRAFCALVHSVTVFVLGDEGQHVIWAPGHKAEPI